MRTLRAVPLCLFLPLLTAQRPDATFEWQKRTTTITYGAVPVGKHSLAELAVGESWRLGNNEASTWQVGMPLLAGETWIAPGQYRVNFHRAGEGTGTLVVDGSGHALGGQDAQVQGEIATDGKESKKLVVAWAKSRAAVAGNQPARIAVQFGPTQWRGEVLALGSKEVKVAGGKLLAFSVPAELVDKGPVPVALLSKGKDGDEVWWNLVLSGTTARLVPWMKAPGDSYGFGEIKPPDAALQTEGTVTEQPGETNATAAVWTVHEAKLAKGELRVVAAYGKKSIEIVVPEPKHKGN
jgi:hypothetical protein